MADEEVSEGGGGGKGKLIIIIVAVLLLLIIGGGAVYYFFFMPKDEAAEETDTPAEISGMAEPLENPIFLPLGSYIANLKDGRRYLKATMQLMLSESSTQEYLTGRLVQVKDIVLSELQNLSVEDTKQVDSKEALKQKIITEITKLFPRDPPWEDAEPIRDVLFEEFYVQ